MIVIHVLGIGESYKYLGFYESDGLECVKSKEMIINLYKHQIKLVWNYFLVDLVRLEQQTLFVFHSCPVALELFLGQRKRSSNLICQHKEDLISHQQSPFS